MEYQNFNIRIDTKLTDGYQVQVDSEGMGEVSGVFKLSPECEQVAAELKNVAALDDSSPLPMNLGLSLYRCLFQDHVGRMLYQALGAIIKEDEKGLRIRLRLSPPEIAALPWEVLYDQDSKSFLCTSEKTPLTRYIELAEPIKALKITPPVKVLALIPGGSGLSVEKEEQIITEALGKLEAVEVMVLKDKVTRAEISRALIEDQYHILHFIGHGLFEADEAHLLINSESGDPDFIGADDFACFFKNHPSLKLVVLNACQGAEVSATKDLVGIAPQLVLQGIPAVIAMQYPISDTAALTFAREFYQRLCTGWTRGQVDTAVSHARNRIKMDVDEPMAFATPVLFLRSPAGIIFDLEQRSGIFDRLRLLFSSVPVKNVNRLKEVKRTYQNNIEVWQEKAKDAPPETIAEAAEAIAQEQDEIRSVEQRIVQWNRTFLASILGTFVIFLMSYVGLFEVVGADSWLERKFIPYMDNYVDRKLSPDVRVVLAEEGVNGQLGTPGPEWRKYHASLINALAGKVRVIVFDLEMSLATDYDKQLAEAIKHAEQSGTHVILSKSIDDDGTTIYDLADELRTVVNDRWGNIKVGGTTRGFVRCYQLAQPPKDGQVSGRQPAEVSAPSLALQTVAQFIAPNSNPQILIDEDQRQVEIHGGQNKSIPISRCGAATYDVPYLLVDYSQIKRATRSYLDVYEHLSDPSLYRDLQGKIVIIGFKTPDDQFRALPSHQRYGTEIHADVISSILTGTFIRSISTRYNLLIVAIMVGVGALVRARFSHILVTRISIPFTQPRKRFDIPGLLILADVVYLLTAFLIYKIELTYILQTYHLVAPFIAYWLTGKMRGRVPLKAIRGS